MNLRINPIIAWWVGLSLLTVGFLGMLARVYVGAIKAMPHGTVADFLFGLMFGIGITLSLVSKCHGPEDKTISIRPSADI